MFLQGANRNYGVNELHFADVYGGHGLWKGVSVQERMEILDLMTGVFETLRSKH